MDRFECIQLRRFVGREWLLWLWFESEVFDATLTTKKHGAFGFWIEGRLVLSAGQETTTIKGTMPGQHREAKESLLRGKTPDLASLHLSWGGHDATFTLKAEATAIAGLKLPRKEPEDASPTEGVTEPARRPAKKKTAAAFADDEAHEDFYERMSVTQEIEEILEALYRDFLTLRLGPAWSSLVVPALEAWSTGTDVDADVYGAARNKAVASKK